MRSIPAVAILGVLVACGPARDARTPATVTTVAYGTVDTDAVGATPADMRGAPQGDTLLIAQGREIVRTLCAACHTEQPPPKLAPPLAHISRRYRMMIGDRDSAIARITAWVQSPAKERALMPPMAIERFGIMAPLPIPEEQRRAAAAYVWSLSEGSDGAMEAHPAHEPLAARGEVPPTSGAAPRQASQRRTPPAL